MADEKKTYTVTTATVPARPRSKARREGEGLTTSGASAIVESATAGNAQRAVHSETANEAAHAAEAVHALNADNAKNATHADEATHAAHAETATSATAAEHSKSADRAATADRATHATEAETLRTPNFADGLNTGAGARIDALGNAEFQSMAVRGFFRAAEYQINRIALSEGDVFHTENGLVKSAEQQADGRWKVVLQERFQGDVTGFRAGDILRGAYNGIGTSGGAAEIRTSWLRVETVDAKAGTLTASLYADNQTPEGRNAPPVPLMRLARWGNTTDPERQSHIMESATDGRIVRRVKVSAPIVDGTQSDGFVVGKLPAWLREHFGAAVADASDYVFARGIITQNILRYTPAGRPLAERVDRGLWSASSRYFYEQQNPETGAFEISRVWHDGALYELARGGNGSTAPAANSTHWTLIQAKPKDGSPGYDGKTAPPTNPNLFNFTAKWRDKEGNIPYQTEETRKGGANITTPDGGKYGTKCFRVQADPEAAPGNNGIYAFNVGKDLITGTLKAEQWYTYSFYVRGKGYLRSAFYFLSNPVVERRTSVNGLSRDNADYLYQPISDEWRRVVCTFRVESGRVFPWFFSSLSDSQSTDDWMEICCAKFEEGEDATPWCLSEEDKKGTDGRDGESYHANLLEDSAFKKGFDQWYPEGRLGVFDDTQTSPVPGTRVVRYDTAMLGDLPFASIVQSVAGRLRPNTTYTFSVWVKTSQELKRATILFAFKPIASLDIFYQHDGEWARCAFTFTTFPEKNGNQSIRLRLNKQEGEASVWFAAPKLEIGDTPTEWTTSENDRKGDPGKDGKSSYTHIAYSQHNDGSGLTFSPTNAFYMGIYTDENPAASSDPARYVWTQFRGDNGRTTYLHIAHTNGLADEAFKDFTTSNPDGREFVYMGTCVDENSPDPTDPNAYRWTKVEGKQGLPGDPGNNGLTSHTHTAYANSADGQVGFTTTPGGADFDYIGIYTDFKEKASDNPQRYAWAKVKGKQGDPGDKGDPGRGIERIETFYLLTADGTAPEDGTRGWRSAPPVPTPQKPWLWTYERVVYSDGTSVRTPVRLDTRLAKDGANAEPTRPNLLDDTDFLQLGRTESAWKIGTHGEEPIAGRANIGIFSSAVDGCVPALCAINPGTKEGEFAQLYQNVGQLIPGRTYTFSAYVRGADVAWLIVYPTPAEHFHPNTVKQDGWTRVSLTFRAPAVQDPDGVLLLLRAWHRETTPHTGYAKSVAWCAPKLEEGGGPTQWCPSFRDQRGADGSPGTRGAAVRFLGDYDKLPTSTAFESGHAGEQYVDVVQVRQGEQVQFYQCKQPHTKSADKVPAADSEWWELGMYQGFIATDLLLARRSLIKNLQVENVVGRDERGNATFELDAATGTAYIGGTATFAGFTRRRPVVITPDNWKEYGGELEDGVIYLNPFRVGTYVIFRGDFGALRPTINTGGSPLNDGKKSETLDNSQAMRYYGAQFMVFNDLEPFPNTLLTVGGLTIGSKQTAIFTMLGHKKDDPTLWWKGEIVGSW